MLLRYDDLGQGPVVILLHGFPLDRSIWEPQVQALRESFRVIVPDLRGYGESVAAPSQTITMDALADDVLETAEKIGVSGPFVLGGLSMGGYVAQSIAIRFPTRLRGLILCDTKAASDSAEAARDRLELANKVQDSQDTEVVVRSMIPRLFARSTMEGRPDLVQRVRLVMESATPDVVSATLRGLATRPDRTGDLSSISIPTLVIVGQEDVISPPSEALSMVEALPFAQLLEVPDSGHLAPLEQPATVNPEIRAFLANLP